MYVVFLLNKKHYIGCTIYVWYLMFVTCYVPGKRHFSRYAAWYKNQCNRKQKSCVYIFTFHPPALWKGVDGLYPMCDLTFGVQHCHMKFTGAGLLRNSNATGEMDKQEYKAYIPCTRQ